MKKWFIKIVGWLNRYLVRILEKEIDRKFREANRLCEVRRKAAIKYEQDNCPHIAGCSPLSEQMDVAGRTSIVWHTLNTGEEAGFCTNCLREFRNSDEDFEKWRKKKSFNTPSSALGNPDFKEKDPQWYVPFEVTFSDPESYDEKWGW